MTTSNRFTEMFQENKVVNGPASPSKRGKIDFGAALGEDKDIENLFRSLHEKPENSNITPPKKITPDPDNAPNETAVIGIKEREHEVPLVTHKPPQHDEDEMRPQENQLTAKDTIQDTVRHTHRVVEAETVINTVCNPTIETNIGTAGSTGLKPGTETGISTGFNSGSETEPVKKIQPTKISSAYSSIDPELWAPFTPNQGTVLLYLIESGGKSNRLHIVRDTGVPFGTVQRTIGVLAKHGYINNIERYYLHQERGFTYTINRQMCSGFYDRLNNRSEGIVAMPAAMPAQQRTGMQTGVYPGATHALKGRIHVDAHKEMGTGTQSEIGDPYSSMKLPATGYPTENRNIILIGPEMSYWQELGVKDRQAQKWCDEFDIEPSDLRQQLAWARWDLVVNERELEIQSPVNWFYGVLRKTAGCYPPAKGYQTPIELRASRLRAQRESEQRAAEELATEEVEDRFRSVLADKDGAEYLGLFTELPDVMKGMKGKVLESALRGQFMKREG